MIIKDRKIKPHISELLDAPSSLIKRYAGILGELFLYYRKKYFLGWRKSSIARRYFQIASAMW